METSIEHKSFYLLNSSVSEKFEWIWYKYIRCLDGKTQTDTYMKIHNVLLLLLLLLGALLPLGCNRNETSVPSEGGGHIKTLDDLNSPEFTIGGEIGTISLREGQKRFPKANVLEYQTIANIYPALQTGKIDAIVFDRPPLDYAAMKWQSFIVLPEEVAVGHIAIGAPFRNEKLIKRVNEFIKQYRSDGTYKKMYQHWVLTSNPVMPDIPDPVNPEGTIIVGADVLNEPMSFLSAEGKSCGFDPEFIRRLALFLNMKCDVRILDYAALFPALESGKIDLAVANLDVTEERKQSMLFSDEYIDCPVAVMLRKESYAGVRAINSVADLKGQQAGIVTGSDFQRKTESLVNGIQYVGFDNELESVSALRSNRIDAVLMNEPAARFYVSRFSNELKVADVYEKIQYGFALRNGNILVGKINESLRRLKNSGDLKKLEAKWLSINSSKEVIKVGNNSQKTNSEQKTNSNKNGTLRYGSGIAFESFRKTDSNNLVSGFDLDVALAVADDLDMKFEYVSIPPDKLTEAVESGRIDMAGGLAKSDSSSSNTSTNSSMVENSPVSANDRWEKIVFSDTFYECALAVLVPKNPARPSESFSKGSEATGIIGYVKRFAGGLSASFHRTFIAESRWQLIVQGLEVTVAITIFAAILGTALAFGVCSARRSKKPLVSFLAKLYIALMQGMPMLVILMLLYYVVFAKIDISAVLVATIGFALNFAAYVGEMFRSGIDGVPRGQIEAAHALGFTRFAVFRKVVFPQALRRILPVYKGEFINMLKMTSIVGYIAIQDLTKMSDIIRSRTYEAFFPLLVTAIIYFATAHLLSLVLVWLEHRLDPVYRRNKAKENVKRQGV